MEISMTKEVELSIAGLQWGTDIEENNIETVRKAEYFKRSGSHYLLYEEETEGFSQTSRNRIKFKEKKVELTRQGLMDTHMIFEENKRHLMNYVTPYGSLLLGINTGKVCVEEQDDCIRVIIEYVLEMEEEPLSWHKLKLCIRERR